MYPIMSIIELAVDSWWKTVKEMFVLYVYGIFIQKLCSNKNFSRILKVNLLYKWWVNTPTLVIVNYFRQLIYENN